MMLSPLDRRAFLACVGAAAASASAGAWMPRSTRRRAARAQPATDRVDLAALGLPPEAISQLWTSREERWVTGEALRRVSMPVGGIFAGEVRLSGDGRLTRFVVGPSARGSPVVRPDLAQGIVVAMRDADGVVWRAALADSAMLPPGATGCDRVGFLGEPPIAEVRYIAGPGSPPAEVSLRVHGVFVPGDAAASSAPLVLLRLRVRNTGQRPMEVGAAAFLENGVGAGDYRNRVVVHDAWRGVELRSSGDDSGSMALALVNGPAEQGAGAGGGGLDMDPLELVAAAHAASPHELVASPGPGGVGPMGWVGARRDVAAGATAEFTFAIAWHFPPADRSSAWMSHERHGAALHVIGQGWADLEPGVRATELFHRTFYEESTLPRWALARAASGIAALSTSSCQWRRDGVVTLGASINAGAFEAHSLSWLFPELGRALVGPAEANGEVDAIASLVLARRREHLLSTSDQFTRSTWESSVGLVNKLLGIDASDTPGGPPDGMIESPVDTMEARGFAGRSAYVSSLYLTALLAQSRNARAIGQAPARRGWEDAYMAGKNAIEAQFDGEQFVARSEASMSVGLGCHSAQLAGQSWARLLDVFEVARDEMVRKALATIVRRNWRAGEGAAADGPGGVRVDAGLASASWRAGDEEASARGDRSSLASVRQRTELMVASGLLRERGGEATLGDAGLVILRAVDARWNTGNPWGDALEDPVGTMAGWGAYLALTGAVVSGPEGVIGFIPGRSADESRWFWSSAGAWGLFSQTRTAGRQVCRVEPRWGAIKIQEVHAQLPAGVGRDKPVLLAGRVVGAGAAVAGGSMLQDTSRTLVTFDTPVTLVPGSALEVEWTW